MPKGDGFLKKLMVSVNAFFGMEMLYYQISIPDLSENLYTYLSHLTPLLVLLQKICIFTAEMPMGFPPI